MITVKDFLFLTKEIYNFANRKILVAPIRGLCPPPCKERHLALSPAKMIGLFYNQFYVISFSFYRFRVCLTYKLFLPDLHHIRYIWSSRIL
jgi:hypothetical protein